MTHTAPLNAMTVDLEDWYQVSAFDDVVDRDRWSTMESRVEIGTERVLALFDRHDVKATFFVLGWIADHLPGLVREVARRGHEVASHGYEHRLVTNLGREEFRADLRRAADAIERAASVRVRGFRAPSFSFSLATPWAHDVLREEGYAFSSSVFPVRHDRYGIPDHPRHPVHLTGPDGRTIWEFPMTTWRVLGRNLPAAGGGWLRAWPPFVNRRAIRIANRAGWPANVYVHPWELDPEQPRLAGVGFRATFRHRLNLRRTGDRLDGLLGRFAFCTVTEALEDHARRRPALCGPGSRS